MNNLEFGIKMQQRTKAFGVKIIKFFIKLPRTDEARVLGKQLLRCGTSVGANYRAVCRSESDADFISKMGTVVEEADESGYWLDVLEDSGVCSKEAVESLRAEAEELLRIFSASLTTAKQHAGR